MGVLQGSLEAAEREKGPDPVVDVGDGRGAPENGSERLSPLDSFREAALHLRRPFTPEAIKFKVQNEFGQDSALIAPYIDARLVVERLNLLVPHLWYDEYVPLDSNFLRCDLTVDGITRRDVGQGAGKAGYSDALKRAAVKFGVGVSLYAIPKIFLKTGKWLELRGGQKKRLAITDDGDAALRKGYRKWLDEHGSGHFGEPLDHGDVLGAIGDVEADEPEQEDDAPIRQLVEGEDADEIRERCTAMYAELGELVGRSSYPPAAFQAGLADAGTSMQGLQRFREELEGRLEAARAKAAA